MRKAMAVVAAAMTMAGAVAAPAGAAKPRADVLTSTHMRVTERVDFHGDAAAGCAERGLCGTSGTITYSFAGSRVGFGALFGARHVYIATLVMPGDGVVDAHVQAAGAAPCHDERHVQLDGLVGQSHGGKIRLTPHLAAQGLGFGEPPLETRCGGPLDQDVAGALPTLDVAVSTLLRPTAHLHLSGTKPFAGGGFAGTVTTDVVMTLHRVRHGRPT